MQRRWRSTIVRQISRLNSAELLTDKETDGLMPMNETTWSARTDGIPWIYRRFVRSFQRGFRCGSLNYALPSGVTGTIRGAAAGPEGTIVLRRWRAVRRLIFRGSLGFAEAYLDGDWESPDLPTFVELVTRNAVNRRVGTFWQRVADRIRHKWRSNTKTGSRRVRPWRAVRAQTHLGSLRILTGHAVDTRRLRLGILILTNRTHRADSVAPSSDVVVERARNTCGAHNRSRQ